MTGILVNKRSFDNFAPTEALPAGRMPDHPSDRAGPERKKLGPESRLGASDLRECSYMRWINAG